MVQNYKKILSLSTTYSIVLCHSLDLIVVVCPRQSGQPIRIEFSDLGVQFRAIVLRQLGSERVDGDDDGTTVSLEGQDFAHSFGSGAAQFLAECEESLQIRLVQGVSDDFDIHLVQVLFADAVDKEGSCKKENHIS